MISAKAIRIQDEAKTDAPSLARVQPHSRRLIMPMAHGNTVVKVGLPAVECVKCAVPTCHGVTDAWRLCALEDVQVGDMPAPLHARREAQRRAGWRRSASWPSVLDSAFSQYAREAG